MSSTQPFHNLFEMFGRLPSTHAEEVNRKAYEELQAVLSVPVEHAGRFILLKAPRAGHGKTHLLARVRHHLSGGHVFVPLHAARGNRIDAGTVTDDILRALLHPLPGEGGVCDLDLLSRRLFALALQPLVVSGEVPCHDREGALSALQHRPVETFDFHHPSAGTAQWAKEQYDILGPRLAIELAQLGNLPIREVTFWLDVLFRFSSSPVGKLERLKTLFDAVHCGSLADGALVERLQVLVGLFTLLVRLVLVADELEGFSADPDAALYFMAFANALRQSAERVDILVSLNEDIWRTAFVTKLSDGLLDRLSEVVVELKPLEEKEIIALIESRVPGRGVGIAGRLDKSQPAAYARGVLKAAAKIAADHSDAGNPGNFPSFLPMEAAATMVPAFEPAPAFVEEVKLEEMQRPAAMAGFPPKPAQMFPGNAMVTEIPKPASPATRFEPEVASVFTASPPAASAPFPQRPPEAASVFTAAAPAAPSPFSQRPPEAASVFAAAPQRPSAPVENSPFTVAPQTFPASPFSAPAASQQPLMGSVVHDEPSEFAAPELKPAVVPAPQNANRVDELLNQFRGLYGRGS